jgi:hypothetical protein
MTSEHEIMKTLESQFHDHVRLKQKRPNIFQVHAPFYHEDGDMLDMYIEPTAGGALRLCDFGKTLMRLSYTFDLDTENKQRIFKDLLRQNQVELDEPSGNIFIDTSETNLCTTLLHFSQVIAKVSRLDVLRRELVSSLFFEMVDKFIGDNLRDFNPSFHEMPLPGRDDLEVDCAFMIKPHPVYLFAVRGPSQARLAALSFLEFQRAKTKFKGYVVHDDFEAIPAKDRKRITSAADKQFVSFADFEENAAAVLSREAA